MGRSSFRLEDIVQKLTQPVTLWWQRVRISGFPHSPAHLTWSHNASHSLVSDRVRPPAHAARKFIAAQVPPQIASVATSSLAHAQVDKSTVAQKKKKSVWLWEGYWSQKASVRSQGGLLNLIRSIETADRVRELDFCKKKEWRHQKISFSALKWNFSTRFGRALHDESNSTRACFHTLLLSTTTFTLQWARPPLIFLATISSFFLPKNSWFFVTS